jgi:GDPmannose 4,6-dehydratase
LRAPIIGVSGQDGAYLSQLLLGNVRVRRDWAWAPEYVDAMWRMLRRDRGDDYVVATGEPRSLEEFAACAFEAVGLDWRHHLESDASLLRPTAIAAGHADPGKVARVLGWKARTTMAGAVKGMIEEEKVWLAERRPTGSSE